MTKLVFKEQPAMIGDDQYKVFAKGGNQIYAVRRESERPFQWAALDIKGNALGITSKYRNDVFGQLQDHHNHL